MGAWGPGCFENDAAVDWTLELVRTSGFALVEGTLDNLLAAEPDELDASDVEEAIAAADLAAHAAAPGVAGLPHALQDWIERIGAGPSPALLGKARAAVRKIRDEPSELRELWEASDDFQGWLASLDGLLGRLNG